MEIIHEFIKTAGKVRVVKKLDGTFNVWVSEVRDLQRASDVTDWQRCSMKDLHRYYDDAILPAQAILIMTPAYNTQLI